MPNTELRASDTSPQVRSALKKGTKKAIRSKLNVRKGILAVINTSQKTMTSEIHDAYIAPNVKSSSWWLPYFLVRGIHRTSKASLEIIELTKLLHQGGTNFLSLEELESF